MPKESKRSCSIEIVAACVAHDLRNVFAGLIGYPDLLLSFNNLNKQQLDILVDVKNSISFANNILNELLEFTKEESDYLFETTDLNDVLKEYMKSIEFSTVKKKYSNVIVRTKKSKQPLLIKNSKPHLVKVIMNLVNNAFESFDKDGSIKISTGEYNFKKNKKMTFGVIQKGSYNYIKIMDNGVGIESENLKKIFDPFYTTYKPNLKNVGYGLGLTIVKTVLKEHDAHIIVKSVFGKGTTFTIYFPKIINNI